jgi:hypothetical protein
MSCHGRILPKIDVLPTTTSLQHYGPRAALTTRCDQVCVNFSRSREVKS